MLISLHSFILLMIKMGIFPFFIKIMTETSCVYSIKNKLGPCIIFNIEEFKNHPEDRRLGTKFDLSSIKTTFSKIGYDVYPVQNPTKNVMEKTMREGMLDNSNNKIIFCFVGMNTRQLCIMQVSFIKTHPHY